MGIAMALVIAIGSNCGSVRAEDDWTTAAVTQPSDSKARSSVSGPSSGTTPAGASAPGNPSGSSAAANTPPFPGVALQYYRYIIQMDDRYMSLPSYNQRYPSSAGITSDQASENLAKTVETRVGNMVYPKRTPLSAEEADAVALPIPALEVGAYGYIKSCVVFKVLGPNEALVKDIQLIDPEPVKALADEAKKVRNIRSDLSTSAIPGISLSTNNNQLAGLEHRMKLVDRQNDAKFRATIKLVGFNTSSMAEGSRWYGAKAVEGKHDGIWIAIVRTDVLDPSRKTQKTRVLTAVPTEKFNQPLNLEQFRAMLSKLSISEQQFVDLVVKEMKADSDSARANVFRALDAAQAAKDGSDEPAKGPGDSRSEERPKPKSAHAKSVFGGE